MKTKRFRNLSLLNLICGYLGAFFLILLILLNKPTEQVVETLEVSDNELFNAVAPAEPEVAYVPTSVRGPAFIDRGVGIDYGRGVILDDEPDVIIGGRDTVAVVDNPSHVVLERDLDRHIYEDKLTGGDIYNEKVIHGDHHPGDGLRRNHGGIHTVNDGVNARHKDGLRDVAHNDVDVGLLDPRLADLDNDIGTVDLAAYERALTQDKIGLGAKEEGRDVAGLTLAKDDVDLGDIDTGLETNTKGYGLAEGGQLYAYDFPSRGVGAGIGSSAIGAGMGGGAGLGAGIGEGVLNGQTVPTLGGVGTAAPPVGGQAAAGAASGGVGGLVGGAGAGGAAGLTQGFVTEKLGLGIGKGCTEHGEGCNGDHSHGHRERRYDHLPRDGGLHIMMHVDGSGSILSTRKQLDLMKDTLLKRALLPYYNNDEDLYNRRVTIVDGSGERTLRFFSDAAEKDNVLAIVFQDEAQPSYHLPNFNRFPEDHYLDDLKALKTKLGSHEGIYRGIFFQVDRGKTFAKSFKEFVGNALQGKGYLSTANLKRYYWEDNQGHIHNKDGVVFSDEYHAKDEGSPEYYLNLLFTASRKVGLDLNIKGAGLTDGQYIKNN